MGYHLRFEGPLVITNVPTSMSDEEQVEYFARIEREVLSPRRRHAALVVAGQPTVWTPEQRKRHVAFHQKNRVAIGELCAATAMVMPEVSMVVRFATSAAMMVAQGTATRLFDSEPKARKWLGEQLSKTPRRVATT